ncbi:MAG: hypothetical protein GY859_33730 [Desulfobacterales bacterium]|nr:hypothetical protein [Desulfobacterales bacterium]
MKKYLTGLKRLLKGKEKKRIFSCIEDLVLNGVDVKRFSGDELTPTRQDATQFILKWFNHIDVPPTRCETWIIGFATEVLSRVSASSASRIRHSTKSNMKFVFNSNVRFECGCVENFFKARCRPDCPEYDRMLKIAAKRKNEIQTWEVDHSKREPRPFKPLPTLKEKYKDQFEEGMGVVAEMVERDIGFEEILNHLRAHDFRTRTGRKWKLSTLKYEMHKHKLRYSKQSANNAMISPVKEKYHDQFNKAIEIVRKKVRRDVKLADIVADLTERGFKTRTGKPWKLPTLRHEMKKHNIEYASNIVHLKPLRSRVRKNYKNQFEKALKMILACKKRGVSVSDMAAELNEKGFVTRTGRKWTYGNVRNELNRHRLERFERAVELIREKVTRGKNLEEILGYLNRRGFETKTGRPWHISILKAEVKKRGFKPAVSPKGDKAQRTSVREMHRKLFEKSLKTIINWHGRGKSPESIASHLNKKSLKTRTGKKWIAGNVRNELIRWKAGKR